MANEHDVDSPEPSVTGTVVHVVVRLLDGDRVVAGTLPDADAARRSAEEVVRGFTQDDGRWPLVQGRYLRPGAVISIDLVEEEHRRWGGSPGRKTIGEPDAAA
jgi:hypothetical protein